MGRTYTYGDVLNLVSSLVVKSAEKDKGIFMLNLAVNKVWKAFPFPQTTAPLPPFALQPGEQDYGAPTVSVPADFDHLLQANFVELTSNVATRNPMHIHRNLTKTDMVGWPNQISYLPSIYSFRIFPRPPVNMAAPLYIIDGLYKILPPKLEAEDIHSTLLPFDDKYMGMWFEVMKWAAYNLSGNPQAGEVQYTPKGISYNGQLAKAMATIDEMARDAGLVLGDAVVTPEPW